MNTNCFCLHKSAQIGKKHIQNLSDYVLSDTEEFVLGHGLNFCLPPKTVCKEQLFAEFESLWAQLQHHKACSVDTRNALKARLTDLAHSYSESQIEKHDFMMQNECYQAAKFFFLPWFCRFITSHPHPIHTPRSLWLDPLYSQAN